MAADKKSKTNYVMLENNFQLLWRIQRRTSAPTPQTDRFFFNFMGVFRIFKIRRPRPRPQGDKAPILRRILEVALNWSLTTATGMIVTARLAKRVKNVSFRSSTYPLPPRKLRSMRGRYASYWNTF